ncbi:MAG: hypothetical protein Q9227_006540 [Pyrenula ochraceoflavens]
MSASRPPPQERQTSTEAFPALEPEKSAPSSPTQIRNRNRTSSSADETKQPRRTSIVRSFLESNPPNGMWQATGEVASKAPTLSEIKNGSFSSGGWTEEGQRERRGTNPHEIQRRRLSRASSGYNSIRTPGTTYSGPAPSLPGLDSPREKDELHPTRLSGDHAQDEAERVPSVIKEVEQTESGHLAVPNSPRPSKPNEEVVSSEAPIEPDPETHPRAIGPDETGTYPNGYRFPPKHTWKQSTVIGLKAFWKFVCTPFGLIITIYGLNVVAWGAMIFFLLLNAAPAMCHPSCNDDYSGRKIWIEIDAQVLNALFCVTGFGLIPWRFRDFYYLMRWRVRKDYSAHRRLAGIYRGWYRLAGSDKLEEHISPPPLYSKKNPQTEKSPPPYSEAEIQTLESNSAIPLPATSMPPAPLTGIRAPPTKPWLLDFVIWMYFANTLLQAVLSGFMWGENRFHRPSWVVGLCISVGCVVAMAAGLAAFFAGKKVKAIEGIPVEEEEVLEDVERGEVEKKKKKDGERGEGEGREGEEPELGIVRTRTRTEKKKGKGWFERH